MVLDLLVDFSINHVGKLLERMFLRPSLNFFTSGELSGNINCNFMVLIPKSKDVDSLDKFRPIVVGSFLF